MAKRKPAPKATYVYVRDENTPTRTPKKGETPTKYRKTGGIKKEKTSPEKSRPLKNTVRVERPRAINRETGLFIDSPDNKEVTNREEIVSRLAGEQLKDVAAEKFRKDQEKDFGDLPAGRVVQLNKFISEMPGSGEVKPKRKENLNPIGDLEATVPARGTGGSRPLKQKPGRRIAGKGTPNVPVGKLKFDKTTRKVVGEEPKKPMVEQEGGLKLDTRSRRQMRPTGRDRFRGITEEEALRQGPARPDRGDEVGGAVVVGKGLGAPDAISGRRTGGKTDDTGAYRPKIKATSTDTRELRSAESIAETSSRAKNRIAGGLKTTEYRPMDVAGRNTSRDRNRRRAQKRLSKGKATSRRVLESASQAEAYAAEKVAKKAKTNVENVQNRDAGAFVYSDEAMAQDLARGAFKGHEHSASEIMEYVKSTGSSMHSFHTHVTNSIKATKKKYDIQVGPPTDPRTRSAGKITRWKLNKNTGDYEAISSYRGFQRKKSRNEEGRNVKGWIELKAPSTKGTISHVQYLSTQIQKWKENKAIQNADTREINRNRRQDRATSSLVDAASQTAATPKIGDIKIPKGRSGRYVLQKPLTKPEAVEKKESPLSTGELTPSFTPKPKKEAAKPKSVAGLVTPEKPTFTEVKRPRRGLNP
jgi:hypothetical protein